MGMASLKHKNISTFVGVCADDRKQFIISDLSSCSLFDLVHLPHTVAWYNRISVRETVTLAEGIAAGVAYLHAGKVVHADLKSSNILVDFAVFREPVPRICDFGHAAVRSVPAPHHRLGTPHWAAPEVLRGEALGPAADVYSTGVVCWEMLTREVPHSGLSFGQVLACVGWAGWTPDLDKLPSSELGGLVRTCLKFIPTERPTSENLQRGFRRVARQQGRNTINMIASFFGVV